MQTRPCGYVNSIGPRDDGPTWPQLTRDQQHRAFRGCPLRGWCPRVLNLPLCPSWPSPTAMCPPGSGVTCSASRCSTTGPRKASPTSPWVTPTSCSTKPTSAGHGERHPSTHPWGAGSTSKSPCPMSPINSGSYAKRAGHCSWSQKRSGTASARAKRRAFASSSYRTPTAT